VTDNLQHPDLTRCGKKTAGGDSDHGTDAERRANIAETRMERIVNSGDPPNAELTRIARSAKNAAWIAATAAIIAAVVAALSAAIVYFTAGIYE
jgi:hypothetical protein